MKALSLAGVLAALLLSSGCATRGDISANVPPNIQSCLQLFAELNLATQNSGRSDAAYARIANYSYLRVDRYTASFKNDASQNLPALIEKMRLLDMDARRFELTDGRDVQRAESCGRQLMAYDLQDRERMRRLVDSVEVPDDYITVYRVLGAYALTKLPFAMGVKRLETERLRQFSLTASESAHAVDSAKEKIAYALKQNPDARLNELHPDAEVERLILAHAPIFLISKDSHADIPGALEWQGEEIAVNTSKPVMYTQATFTRYGELSLRQLVYTIWFSERPATKGAAIDLLAGKLDGLTVRVTLSPNGEALIYDSIHPCGCYHQFFPTAKALLKSLPSGLDEWAFIPKSLPSWQPGDRLLLQVASGTHYIDQVDLVSPTRGTSSIFSRPQIDLQPLAYDTLRALPKPNGGYRSAFDPHGFIRGSERLESWLFWPMGIANAGAMRQWGKHATAFVGRRHFDDPRLMEERFVFDLR
jgi:hypothetical protein